MKTYAVPVMYYIGDEPSDSYPEVIIVKAKNEHEALEVAVKQLVEEETQVFSDNHEEGEEVIIPAIWHYSDTDDEYIHDRPDEEGYVLGDPKEVPMDPK